MEIHSLNALPASFTRPARELSAASGRWPFKCWCWLWAASPGYCLFKVKAGVKRWSKRWLGRQKDNRERHGSSARSKMVWLALTSINSRGRFPAQCVIFITRLPLRSVSWAEPQGNGDGWLDKVQKSLLFLGPFPPTFPSTMPPHNWQSWPWSRRETFVKAQGLCWRSKWGVWQSTKC